MSSVFVIGIFLFCSTYSIQFVRHNSKNACNTRIYYALMIVFTGMVMIVGEKKGAPISFLLCTAWMFCVLAYLWIKFEAVQKDRFVPIIILVLQSFLLFLEMDISNRILGTNHPKGGIPVVLFMFALYFLTVCIKNGILMYLFIFFMGALSIINSLVIQVRGTPVLSDDFYSLQTAVNIVDHYRFVLDEYLLVIVGITVLLIDSLRKIPRQTHTKMVINFVMAVACLAILWYGPWYGTVNLHTWNTQLVVQRNGYFCTLVGNLKIGMIGSPEGYSLHEIDQIILENRQSKAEGYRVENSNEQPPNIIVIMNESFTDLNVVGDFETTEDFMPFIHSLEGDNVVKNWLVTSKGGGTSISESEFLLSTSNANYWGSLPYIRNIKSQTPSLVTVLKEQGYYTVGIHPETGSNYNRSTVYPCLGFDEYYFIENGNFDTNNMVNNNVSDINDYKKIIYLYENRPENQPFFCFNVTIQNHGPYINPLTVEITSFDAEDDVERYLSCIKESDQAFKELIEYFSEQENTIILMFGDHQPTLDDSFYETLLGKKMEDFSEEELLKTLTVPYIMWANYDVEIEDVGRISTNYLAPYLLNTVGLKMSDFQSFVWEMHDKLPVVHNGGCIDNVGKIYTYDGTEYIEWTDQYRLLTYNYIFDTSNRREEFFHIK